MIDTQSVPHHDVQEQIDDTRCCVHVSYCTTSEEIEEMLVQLQLYLAL
jgi:hypothetical protein